MSAYLSSDLSNSSYLYDVVVAVSQDSLNATMLEYIWNQGLNTVLTTACYVADSNGNPTEISYDQLKRNANGTDPFAVPATEEPGSAKLNDLQAARFMFGFQMGLGSPPGYQPAELPDMVSLSTSASGNQSSSVTFNLLCKTFQIVQYTPATGYASPSWMNISQPPGNAWIYSCNVNMRMDPYNGSDYSNLPQDVQTGIQNLGSTAFSVQQLLFDLLNAGLQSSPKIEGVVSGTPLDTLLNTVIVNKYFGGMQEKGQPILSYAICPQTASTSSLNLTSLDFQGGSLSGANPTLDYLCGANGNTLQKPFPFTWDWMATGESLQFDGVMSINRNTLASWIWGQMQPTCAQYCLVPSTRCWLDSGSIPQYSGNFTQAPAPTPWSVTFPAAGPTVLNLSYYASSFDQAGVGGCLGKLTLSTSYSANVVFQGNTIIVQQHLVEYIDLMKSQSEAKGNFYDHTITDTYTIAVTEDGFLTVNVNSESANNSVTPSVNAFLNFFTGLNDLITGFQGYAPTNFTDIPISFIQGFVFPGGNTFTFKDATFSNYQDLVTHITYCDPVAKATITALPN